MGRGLVRGVGINDADYPVYEHDYNGVGGKRRISWTCPFYSKWSNMIERAYSMAFHTRHPSYTDVVVCEEWLTFSKFRKWMYGQDWEGKHLDKDLLFKDNKVYSPNTCVFIEGIVNTFVSSCSRGRGGLLLGCCLSAKIKGERNIRARCRDPFKENQDYIGLFDTEIEAHFAWKYQKHLYSCQLANSEYVTDERVRQVLLHKYENYNIVEDHIK